MGMEVLYLLTSPPTIPDNTIHYNHSFPPKYRIYLLQINSCVSFIVILLQHLLRICYDIVITINPNVPSNFHYNLLLYVLFYNYPSISLISVEFDVQILLIQWINFELNVSRSSVMILIPFLLYCLLSILLHSQSIQLKIHELY